ncbi:hypothetical protein [Acinetobacter sp. c3-l95]|uniref:hypothetical protein n=1 Tax=Acinetobacter sp. c3-l95 TaxID=3342804 RepID=UPI0035BB6225
MRLKLALTQRINDSKAKQRLPLPLNRKLGQAVTDDSSMPVDIPSDTPKAKRLMSPVLDASFNLSNAHNIGLNLSAQNHAKLLAKYWASLNQANRLICHSYFGKVNHFYHLGNAQYYAIGQYHLLAGQQHYWVKQFVLYANQQTFQISPSVSYCSLSDFAQHHGTLLHGKTQCKISKSVLYQNGYNYQKSSRLIVNQHTAKTQPAVIVPCRHYPIEENQSTIQPNACRIRPPSSQLPIALNRRKNQRHSDRLPLRLACWHDQAEDVANIPLSRSYIMLNTISATLAGIQIDPLNFDIKTDMNSYCWSGNVEITAKDYQKIKAKLDVERGKEPILNININGFMFGIIAEEQSHSRQFGKTTHRISGRSITARLGADYAKIMGDLQRQDLYASQLARQTLENSGVEWVVNVDDWLIPSHSYSTAEKTPIAVLGDIAKACGGFLVSHANQAQISIKKRWQVPAWDLATAKPNRIIPLDVIRQINSQKRTAARFNTVTLTGQKEAGMVYRQQQSRDLDAPVQDNPLFTERNAIVPAGIAVLSESGTHQDESLTLRWANKFNLPLAELGEIWQVNDIDGAWKGIVTAVNVNVRLENDVPTVWQNVSLDRYLDV